MLEYTTGEYNFGKAVGKCRNPMQTDQTCQSDQINQTSQTVQAVVSSVSPTINKASVFFLRGQVEISHHHCHYCWIQLGHLPLQVQAQVPLQVQAQVHPQHSNLNQWVQ